MRKVTIKTILFVIIITLSASGQNIRFENASAFSGSINSIYVRDNYAFCTGHSALEVFDISNPENLALLGGYPVESSTHKVTIRDDYAYLAASNSGFLVFDISTFPITHEHGSYQTSGETKDFIIKSETAYIANGEAGLHIVDITNPSSPSYIGECATPNAILSVAVYNEYAFAATAFSEIYIIDLADPEQPNIIDAITTDWDIATLAVNGDELYILNYHYYDMVIYGRIDIYRILNPAEPSLISQINSDEPFLDIYFDDEFAFAANGCLGLKIYNIENPVEPSLIGQYTDLRNSIESISVEDGIAYAGYWKYLRSLDISDPANPELLSEYNIPRESIAIRCDSNLAYIGLTIGFQILDISNPYQPVMRGGIYDYNTIMDIKDICVCGNYVYLACFLGSNISIIDISDIDAPYRIGIYSDNYLGTYAVKARDNLAYVSGAGHPDFSIVDVSDPSDPLFISGCETSGRPYEIEIEGNYAYHLTGYGLYFIDISNSNQPEIITIYILPDAVKQMKIRDGYAFIASENGYFGILYVADPYNIYETGSCNIPDGVKDIVVYGDKAFLACDGVVVIDISQLSNPHIIETWDSPGQAKGISYHEGNIILADNYSSIILNYTFSSIDSPNNVSKLFSLANNYPNPFNVSTTISYTLPYQSNVTLDIYDILGRKVETLNNGNQSAGSHSIIWNADGFSSGVYFYKLTAGEYKHTQKMMLLK